MNRDSHVVTVPIHVRLPTIPNFIMDSNGNVKISIYDLTEKQATDIAEQWKQAFIAKSKGG